MEVELKQLVQFPDGFPEATTGILLIENNVLYTGHDTGFVVEWNIETNEYKILLESDSDVRSISHHENKLAIGYRSGGLYIIDLNNYEILVLQEPEHSKYKRVWKTIWLNNNNLLVTSTYGDIKLYTFDNNNEYIITNLKGHNHSIFAANNLSDEYIITGDWEGKIFIWNNEHEIIQKLGVTDTIQDIFWYDYNQFVGVDKSGKIYLFEKSSSEPLNWKVAVEVDVANSVGHCVVLTEDRETIFAGTDNEIIQFDIDTQQAESISITSSRKLFTYGNDIYTLLVNGLFYFQKQKIRIEQELINYKYSKISLLGHTGTGKTTFCKWLIYDEFIKVPGTHGKLIWNWILPKDNLIEKRVLFHDHGGQETVLYTFLPFLKDSDIILLFYMQKDRTTFVKALDILNIIKDELSTNVKIYLIETHVDDPVDDITEMEIEGTLKATNILLNIKVSPYLNEGKDNFIKSVIENIDWSETRTMILSPLIDSMSKILLQLHDEDVSTIPFEVFKNIYERDIDQFISMRHLEFLLKDCCNNGIIEYYPKISNMIIINDKTFNELRTNVPVFIGFNKGIVNIYELYKRFGENEYLYILDEMYIKSNISIQYEDIRVFPYQLSEDKISIPEKYIEQLKSCDENMIYLVDQELNIIRLLNIFSTIMLQCITVTKYEGLFTWKNNAYIYYVFNRIRSGINENILRCSFYIGGTDDKIKNRLHERFLDIITLLYGEELIFDEKSVKKKEVKEKYDFDVAVSFASEQRGYVEQVVIFLESQGIDVFYDKFLQASLWGKDLKKHLTNIFYSKAKYCIMFISNEYMEKIFPTIERESALARALEENKEYILPVIFDDIDVPGLDDDIVYLDGRKYTPEYIAKTFIEKWESEK